MSERQSLKLVFFGPGLAGKSTNLRVLKSAIPGATLESVARPEFNDRVLVLDFDVPVISGPPLRARIETEPG
jgi:GTPase SAR1 family protein